MFDFSALTAVSKDDYSFVGIQNEKLYLPKGCEEWAKKINNAKGKDKFNEVRNAFFLLYNTLQTYRSIKPELTGKHDSAQRGEGGKQFLGFAEDDDGKPEEITYQNFALDGILATYDEFAIRNLVNRIGRSEKIDYSRLHKHLDHAIYLEDDSLYIDEMLLPRRQLLNDPAEIVQMFCYVVQEIRKQTGSSEALPEDIQALAAHFSENHLAPGDSLFEYETWESTRNILQERLSVIDKETAYKDEDYHDYRKVLEQFLSEKTQEKDGEFWGISVFHPVWESMCLAYVVEIFGDNVKACDASNLLPVLESELKNLTHYESEKQFTEKLDQDLSPITDKSNLIQIKKSQHIRYLYATFLSSYTKDDLIINDANVYPDAIINFNTYFELEEFFKKEYSGCLQDGNFENYYNVDHEAEIKKYSDNFNNTNNDNGDKIKVIRKMLKSKCYIFQSHIGVDKEIRAFINGITEQIIATKENAFLLGRAFAGAVSSEKTDTRYMKHFTIYSNWVDEKKTPLGRFYIDFLHGIICEIFFNHLGNARSYNEVKSFVGINEIRCDHIISKADRRVKNNFLIWKYFSNLIPSLVIIDFKYLPLTYFFDRENKNFFRNTSVRKQFTYEYLLKNKCQDKGISSQFWIPGYDSDIRKVFDFSPKKEFLQVTSSAGYFFFINMDGGQKLQLRNKLSDDDIENIKYLLIPYKNSAIEIEYEAFSDSAPNNKNTKCIFKLPLKIESNEISTDTIKSFHDEYIPLVSLNVFSLMTFYTGLSSCSAQTHLVKIRTAFHQHLMRIKNSNISAISE